MKEIVLETRVTACQLEELGESARLLIEKAIKATAGSYAPYSGFHVGAAVRLGNGVEITGANQENAAYPLTLCAERTAIFSAQAQYPEQPVVEIAIAAADGSGITESAVSPCGSCRQVMVEVERRYGKPMKVYLYGRKGVYVAESAESLLPLSFSLS